MSDKPYVFNVGDGAHSYFNGDSYPYTIRRVSPSGKRVWASRDDHKPLESVMYKEGNIKCEFIQRDVPDTEWAVFYLNKHGSWKELKSRGGFTLYPGREYSQNPCF